MRTFQGRIAHVRCLAYSPDGSTVASAGNGGIIRLWDPFEGREKGRFRFGFRRVSAVSFSPDGTTIAAVIAGGVAHLWSIADGRKVGMFLDRMAGAVSLGFRPDGRALLTAGGYSTHGGGRGFVTIWELDPRRSVARFTTVVGVWCAVFSPDGSRVAIGSGHHWISLWDPVRHPEGPSNRGPVEGKTPGHFGEVEPAAISQSPGARCLCFSPDGRTLAASGGWSVHLYDLLDGRRVASMDAHRQMVKALDISPDGRTLASASYDGTVRFWDIESAQERACYDWGIGKVDCVAFSPDGMTVAAGGEGGVVLWDVE
jgi:WD40 repeat protein